MAAKKGPLAAGDGLICKGPDEGDGDQSSDGSNPVAEPLASGTDEDSGQKEPIGANGRYIAPGHRGGGSRGTRETTTHTGTLSEKAPRPKVELIAARDSGDWELFVEIESVDPSKLRVLQGTNCLLSTSHALQFGPLHDLTPLQILHDEVKVVDKELITDVAPILYFHLHNEFARQVRRPSRGLTLAVVPERWEHAAGRGLAAHGR